MKQTTLCYPIVNGNVLLAMKKRGFGAGKWNGPGGKIEQGESVEDACRRETREEAGINVGVLEHRGVVEFVFENKPEWDNHCTIFVTTDVTGKPVETEEMRPQWYALENIPLAEMWEDDAVWLMDVLRGGVVNRRFHFSETGKMLRHEDLSSSSHIT
jgi:ADP-ribose pyrophosphatase YjhB (NUDIX family)